MIWAACGDILDEREESPGIIPPIRTLIAIGEIYHAYEHNATDGFRDRLKRGEVTIVKRRKGESSFDFNERVVTIDGNDEGEWELQ